VSESECLIVFGAPICSMSHLVKPFDDPVNYFIPEKYKQFLIYLDPTPEMKPSVAFCPYCGWAAFVGMKDDKYPPPYDRHTDLFDGDMLSCRHCFEMYLYDKFTRNIDKSDLFQRLHDKALNMDDIQNTGRIQKALVEQSLVLITSGLEGYLKDVYATLDIRVNGSMRTLDEIRTTVKTLFQNTRNWEELLKKVGIDTTKSVDNRTLWTIQLFFELRHVIVHNASRVDLSCQDKINDAVSNCPELSGIKIVQQTKGSQINVTLADVKELRDMSRNVVEQVDFVYEGLLTEARKQAILDSIRSN
jgi:hypothetical protein